MESPSPALTPRKRILMAFDHQKADRIPVFDVANNPELFKEMIGMENPWSDGAPTVLLAKKLGLDAAMVPVRNYTALIPRPEFWTGPSSFKDRFGVGYTVSETSWPLGMPTIEPALDREFLDVIRHAVITNDDFDPIEDAVRAGHTASFDEIAVFAGVRSAFSFLTVSAGLVGVSLLIYEDPDLLHELVEAATDYWTQVGLRAIELGVDALYVANDMGMNGSTLISPTHLREFFLPAFARQCTVWKKAGGRVILHSCGNIEAILPDLAAMGSHGLGGFDGLNNLQSHAGMNIASVKERYGRQWTLIGNVDATTVMTSSRLEDIDEAILSVIQCAGDEGGLILATDHSFHKGIPIENVLHFIERAKTMGRYSSGLSDREKKTCMEGSV
ncbi:MAG: uroporphyrinogen decarboxylase family protein [Sphaerochaeta sp.]|nr:uroporphyrinogen decarboxylase family protein [Sphaerochaeta sp.]